MKKKVTNDFYRVHQSWSTKTAQLQKMENEGLQMTAEYKVLKKEADHAYKEAVAIMKSSSQDEGESLHSSRKLAGKESLITKYLLEDLSYQEEEVIQVIWRNSLPFTNDDVAAALPIAISSMALANCLKNLTIKGFISFDGLKYTVVIDEGRYKYDVLQKIATIYFNGSFTELGSFLVHRREFGYEELDKMITTLGTVINQPPPSQQTN